ncbi:hypothetical protein C5167_000832 [Papaver somniferum]|uniref:Uncharacterized protein n=1 Tax=Papaver somniferum TaxID=3469 RepID=A0A4Y7KV76_PAPSO|nr:hypothetical protein C5167_000832 [Papaver somniferum]
MGTKVIDPFSSSGCRKIESLSSLHSIFLEMARHRGGHVKQVSRGDPMTTPQYSSSPPTQERAPTNMRSVNAMGGTSLNVSKSRKRPAAAVTTPQRPLKRRQ